MKIAIISSLHTPVQSDFPGGIEVFNFVLSSELQERGHHVTLFASGDSKVNVKLISLTQKSLFNLGLDVTDPMQMRRLVYYENNFFLQGLDQIKPGDFDIIHHSHTMVLPLYIIKNKKIPHLLTTHLSSPDLSLVKGLEMGIAGKDLKIISISHKQEKILSQINFFKNVYNGIHLTDFSYNDQPKDYLAWMGRFVKNKGPEEAIKVAVGSKKSLKMAGQPELSQQALFDSIKKQYYRPGSSIQYIGPVDKNKRMDFLRNARAFLMPIQWEEPFGLVMIEAMACGTPVIAFDRGSVREIIKDGETGFICPPDDIDSMVKKVKEIYEMPEDKYQAMRQASRKHVEENFTVEKMVDGYEKVYQEVIEDWKKKNT